MMLETSRMRRVLFETRDFPCFSKGKYKSVNLLLYSLFPEEGRDVWVEEALLEFRARIDALFDFLYKVVYGRKYPNCLKGKLQFLYLLSQITPKRGTAKKLLSLLF